MFVTCDFFFSGSINSNTHLLALSLQVAVAGRRNYETKEKSMPGRMRVGISMHDKQDFLQYKHNTTSQALRTDGCAELDCDCFVKRGSCVCTPNMKTIYLVCPLEGVCPNLMILR